MTTVTFLAGDKLYAGYLALPKDAKGSGILVLHAWWGLNDVFKSVCNQLAAQGFVAFAPDLNHGKVVQTIEEATHLMETRDFPATQTAAEAAMHYLQHHPALGSPKLSAIGFSMGAAFALLLDALHPDNFDKLVLFYGGSDMDITVNRARMQFHFAEADAWEPLENVKKMQSPNAEIHIYPNTSHWFFEPDRPDAYNPQAADLAWQRAVEFLK